MEAFNFAEWHESLSGFTSGAWVDDVTARALQHWHDTALGIWTRAGSPMLPLSRDADPAGDDSTYADLPEFSTWLLRHGPATGQWFIDQCWHADNAALNTQLDYAHSFWQCCAMFTHTLNTAWAFV